MIAPPKKEMGNKMGFRNYNEMVELGDLEETKDIIAFGLTWKGIIYLLLGFTIFATSIKTIDSLMLNTLMAFTLIPLVVWFAWFNGDQQVLIMINYLTSIKKANMYNTGIDLFMPIEEVKDDVIQLDNGHFVGIIEVYPIDYGIKSTEAQKSIIQNFAEFLNSLTFPVKIMIRTVALSLDTYLRELQEESQNLNQQKNPIFETYKTNYYNFWKAYCGDKVVKNKVFYIYVSSENLSGESNQLTDKNFKLEELSNKITFLMERLNNMGLKCQRLTTNKLISFVKSYFDGTYEKDEDYDFPVAMSAAELRKKMVI